MLPEFTLIALPVVGIATWLLASARASAGHQKQLAGFNDGHQQTQDELLEKNKLMAFELLTVSNKMAALDYAEQIVASGTNNLIVIVDKDLEGVTCSPIPLRCVIRTQGYSWENELWSPKVINEVARIISNSNIMVASLINKNLPMLQKRLKYLSLLNAVSCLYGTALLSNSNSLAGIRFRLPSLPVDEVKRISSQFKSSAASGCSLSRNIIRESSNAESRAIIRGHLWENVAFRLISYAYKQATGENFPPNGVLQRIAFSVLKRDVNSAIGSDLTKYYRDELLRLSVIT